MVTERPALLGSDIEFTSGSLAEFQASPTIGSPFIVGTIPVGQHYDYRVLDAQQFAVFADYALNLSDRITANLGVRAEHIQYDYENQMLTGRTKDDGEPCGFEVVDSTDLPIVRSLHEHRTEIQSGF